jgi:SAM-dependent methyltransferase
VIVFASLVFWRKTISFFSTARLTCSSPCPNPELKDARLLVSVRPAINRIMLHKSKVLRAVKGNAIRQTRKLLGVKARPKAPVLNQPVENIIERHSMICRRLADLWPQDFNLNGGSVCEIGPGDCLASTAFFVAKGARHVDLVELQPPVVNEKQFRILSALKEAGFPISLDILCAKAGGFLLNADYISYFKDQMENYRVENQHGLVFSHHVLEHVEDLNGMFTSAHRALQAGGRMIHVVDLGGHGEFEDPIPPLDFQTYSDWLFAAMYPTHQRNTRRFLADYRAAAARAGFKQIEIRPTRTADQSYLAAIHARLRAAARQQPVEDIAVIEFNLTAVK